MTSDLTVTHSHSISFHSPLMETFEDNTKSSFKCHAIDNVQDSTETSCLFYNRTVAVMALSAKTDVFTHLS